MKHIAAVLLLALSVPTYSASKPVTEVLAQPWAQAYPMIVANMKRCGDIPGAINTHRVRSFPDTAAQTGQVVFEFSGLFGAAPWAEVEIVGSGETTTVHVQGIKRYTSKLLLDIRNWAEGGDQCTFIKK